jgi:hypothetical protein
MLKGLLRIRQDLPLLEWSVKINATALANIRAWEKVKRICLISEPVDVSNRWNRRRYQKKTANVGVDLPKPRLGNAIRIGGEVFQLRPGRHKI